MKKIILAVLVLLLSGCEEKNYHVALYKDMMVKDGILAVFTSHQLEMAMYNCQSTVNLYKVDDEKNNSVSLVTSMLPKYYCDEVSESYSF